MSFCAPFLYSFHFTPFTLALMLPVCSDETSSMLFLRFSDKYDDNLIDYYVFQSLYYCCGLQNIVVFKNRELLNYCSVKKKESLNVHGRVHITFIIVSVIIEI